MRPAHQADLAYGAALLLLGGMTVCSGGAAQRHLSPSGALQVSSALDDLELPRALPNSTLTRDDGAETRLWDLVGDQRSIVTFYAPWCGPCQEELPQLVGGMQEHPGRLVVVVGSEESPSETRRELDNLGLEDLRFHLDGSGQLAAGGRVTALPATFLVGRQGRVLDRVVGYSGFRLHTLLYKAGGGAESAFGPHGN